MYLFELEFSLDISLGVGILDDMVTLFLVFKGTSILFSIVAAPIYIPTNSVGRVPFWRSEFLVIFILLYWNLLLNTFLINKRNKEYIVSIFHTLYTIDRILTEITHLIATHVTECYMSIKCPWKYFIYMRIFIV